ncbi:MAG: 30S ribosomal protein S17 [Candidatus Eisenbacteria bacterium]|jgi:small subunit ribosomal protein S17
MKATGRKTRSGVVISNKMQKTVVVESERRLRHPVYGKVIKKRRRFYADDPKQQCQEGDLVRIVETRPLSKLKRWRVAEVLKKAE